MGEWKVLNARITFFTVGPVSSSDQSALSVYRQFWEADPDSFQKQPNPLAPSMAQGRRGGLLAACTVNPTRTDLNLAAADTDVQGPHPTLSLIEDAGQLRVELTRITDAVGRGVISRALNRVALYVQFVATKPTLLAVNKTLMSIIPDGYRPNLTDEESFIFQINRPQVLPDVEQLRMNYITKWSAESIRVVTMLLPRDPAVRMGPPNIGSPIFGEFLAASLSFDINNVPAPKPLTPPQQSSLLLNGMAWAAETQRTCGLNIEGFDSVNRLE